MAWLLQHRLVGVSICTGQADAAQPAAFVFFSPHYNLISLPSQVV